MIKLLRARLPHVFIMLVLAALPPACAISAVTISVDNETVLSYPAGMDTLADEHTTIIPIGDPEEPLGYRFFVASDTAASGDGRTGAVVLETRDLVNFDFAEGFGDPSEGGLVLWAPVAFSDCSFAGDSVFDQNYAAPGSVLYDPTRGPGHMLMLYEAEQHCNGTTFNHDFYASIGFARSEDDGHTWPQPGDYGTRRYPVLQVPGTIPSMPPSTGSWSNMGDALPSGFIDKVPFAGKFGFPFCPGYFLYALYTDTGTQTTQPDGYLRVARAQLGGEDPLSFYKWNNGSWSGAGIGGPDSKVTSVKGCGDSAAQIMSQITYNEDLHAYLLTFVCVNVENGVQTQGGWYFSTATSLEKQDWSDPQLIQGTQGDITGYFPPTGAACGHGMSFDGWYPSFMSPRFEAGHTGKYGKVFYMYGCDGALGRRFMSRDFKISVSP